MNKFNNAAHLSQRVAIFIDTQNIYHSAKTNYRTNVNYEKLIEAAVSNRSLIRAFAYVIKSEDNTEAKFIEALEDIGIEIRIKDLQIFHTGVKKADWDVGIAVDMIRMTEKVDVVVLASGDGDFLEVIRYCQSRGVRVEVMAFEKTSNDKLVEEADHFVDLGSSETNFLIGRRVTNIKKESARNVFSDNKNFGNGKYPTKNLNTGYSSNHYSKNTSAVFNSKKIDAINPLKSLSQKKRKIHSVTGLPIRKKLSLPKKTYYSNKYDISNAFGNSIPKNPQQ